MTKKSNNTLALEVLCGKWGSGKTRKERLTKAGYNYDAVQKIVNDRMTKKPIDTVAHEVIDGKWGNGSVRRKCLTVAGYNYDAVQNRVNEILKPQETIIDKELAACKIQAEWMKNYTYSWPKWKPRTVEMSKKYGTCVTFVACVMYRLGYLKEGKYIWHDGNGHGTGKVVGTNNKMTVAYMNNKTFAALKDKLKAGDIVMVDDNKSGEAGNGGHIMIFTGKWNSAGKPIIWDNHSAERIKKGISGQYGYPKTRKILAVVRLKEN